MGSRLVAPFWNEELEDPFEKPSSYENNSENSKKKDLLFGGEAK